MPSTLRYIRAPKGDGITAISAAEKIAKSSGVTVKVEMMDGHKLYVMPESNTSDICKYISCKKKLMI